MMKELPILMNGDAVRAILDDGQTQDRRPIKPQPTGWNPTLNTEGAWLFCVAGDMDYSEGPFKSPFGAPGDHLYVRETWRIAGWNPDYGTVRIQYKTDGKISDDFETEEANLFERWWVQSTNECLSGGFVADENGWFQFDNKDCPTRWRSSTQMHKWASRITLEVERVWAERVQEISPSDCEAEGITGEIHASPVRGQPYSEYRNGDGLVYAEPKQAFAALWDSIYDTKGFGWDTNCWVFGCEFKVLEGEE